jgi:class 3 adenylate cyclase
MSEPVSLPPPVEQPAPRRRVAIATVLSLAIAALVGLAVATVVIIGYRASWRTTLGLTQEKGELVLSGLEASVRELMHPPDSQLAFIAEILSRPAPAVPLDRDRLIDLLTGAMAAAPQVQRLIFIDPDGTAVTVQRGTTGASALVLDLSSTPGVRRSLEEAAQHVGGYWGELVYDSTLRQTLINRRYAVWRDNRFVGALGAFVSTRQLSDAMLRDASAAAGTRFILFDRDRVLAHARLAEPLSGLDVDSPLPALAQIADPVLAGIWSGPEPVGFGHGSFFHRVTIGSEEFAFLQRVLYGFGPTPWRLGVYFRMADIGQELDQVILAAAAGVAVLILAVICAILLGRRLARPIRRVADAANALRESGFARFQALPGSHVREIDDQVRAFNAMQNGLRWFRAYVPRSVVRRLMSDPDGLAAPSVEREITVMFTDIVGFTSLSETMDAADVAALLDHHFELVTHAVDAEGGTVDKFIGDAVMAFWNAPKRQDDHAEAAVRAALAIAEALHADNVARAAAGGRPIAIRIGVHTGPAIVGNIGPAGRLNYTAIGDSVNTAQRIQGLGRELCRGAADAGILVSGATAELLRLPFPLESVGTFNLRGRAQPVAVYRLWPRPAQAQAGQAASPPAARAAGGSAP